MRRLVWIFVAACAHGAPPATPCPTTTAGEVALTGEDAALRRWRAIVADDMRVPAGTTAAALVPELEAYLRSPDPGRRDGVAYEVLDRWIRKRVLVDDEVRALAQRLIAQLRGPLDGGDGVFGRSFAALVLASVVARDVETPLMSDDARRGLLAAARDYAHREVDLRGYTGARGWAHAAAHTADLLAQLARLPSLTEDDRAVVLDAVAGFVVRRHGEVLHHGEDGRLGVAVVAAAKRGLAPAALAAWLASVKAPIVERWGPAFDAGRYAAQRNARNLLFTLFVQVSMGSDLTDGQRALLDGVRGVLAD